MFLLMFIACGANAQVAQWKFDERSGTTNNIAFVGDSSLDINSTTNVTRGVAGPTGFIRAIQGTNTYNYISTDTLVTGTNSDTDLRITGLPGLTLAMWIKSPTNLGSSYVTVMDQGNVSYENYGIQICSNKVAFVMSDGTQRKISNAGIDWRAYTNTWAHLAVTLSGATNYSSNSFSFYVNGALLATNSNAIESGTLSAGFGLVSCTNPGPVVVMNMASLANPTNGWTGSLDDLRIYSNALSQAAISNLFAIPSSPVSTNSYYIGAGSRIYDASGVRYYVNNSTNTYGTNVVDWINNSNGTISTNKIAAGFADATITNGYATQSYVLSQVGSASGGLTNYVLSQVGSASGGLTNLIYAQVGAAASASTNYTDGLIQGLTNFVFAQVGASANSATNYTLSTVGSAAGNLTNYINSTVAGVTNGGFSGIITNLSTLSTNIFWFSNGVVTNVVKDP
jgi:hypothetical protein